VVCDADVCAQAGWELPDFAAACMDGGATLLQVRAKQASSRAFLAAADAIVARAASAGAAVVINDRADIARLAGASGVHVGQDDLSAADVRTVVGPSAVVGLSTHTPEQLVAAIREPVSYVAIGPVFGTRTKDTGYDAVGLAMVAQAARSAGPSGLPLVAIGGITIDSAPDVIAAGAASVAVITDILVANDPAARVRAYLDRLSRV
jgi:thiamine-phosphate pyrophosphorylase